MYLPQNLYIPLRLHLSFILKISLMYGHLLLLL
jgi:hypothetical protein